jgi:hypothetical protein
MPDSRSQTCNIYCTIVHALRGVGGGVCMEAWWSVPFSNAKMSCLQSQVRIDFILLHGCSLHSDILVAEFGDRWLTNIFFLFFCCNFVHHLNLKNTTFSKSTVLRLFFQILTLGKVQKYEDFLFQTFALFWMLYAFFWVIPRRLNFICWRFGTLCSIFMGGSVYEDETECSEMSAYKIQTPVNYPEESIQQGDFCQWFVHHRQSPVFLNWNVWCVSDYFYLNIFIFFIGYGTGRLLSVGFA